MHINIRMEKMFQIVINTWLLDQNYHQFEKESYTTTDINTFWSQFTIFTNFCLSGEFATNDYRQKF